MILALPVFYFSGYSGSLIKHHSALGVGCVACCGIAV
jgi:hypothetical protein